MDRRSASRSRTRRKFVGEIAAIAGITPLLIRGAAAQSAARVPRIGYLGGDFPELRNAFMNELRARGFVDGENVHIERRLVNDLSE
ncbi:MAG TPA: hypothetical protein VFU13_15805, partial [Steroidobacteraceae bacterium]|nr:hypothetical protein [Steroidobacteraceae bacterium]